MGGNESKQKHGKERDKSPNYPGGKRASNLDGNVLDDEEYLKMVKRRREKDAAKHE